MESYYKRYDILDLDTSLLKNLPKINRKDELFTSNNFIEIETSISKHHIKASSSIKLYA